MDFGDAVDDGMDVVGVSVDVVGAAVDVVGVAVDVVGAAVDVVGSAGKRTSMGLGCCKRSMRPMPSCPTKFAPQHLILSPVTTAQAWPLPTDTDSAETPGEGVSDWV